MVCLLASGPAGNMICGGLTTTACCTLAQAVTESVGTLVDEVLSVIWPCRLGCSKGGLAVIVMSKSLPTVLVFNSAVNLGLLLSGAESVTGSSRLLTIWTLVVTLVWVSAGMVMTANCGWMSMGFQTVPLSCRPTEGWVLSLEVTVTVLRTWPP